MDLILSRFDEIRIEHFFLSDYNNNFLPAEYKRTEFVETEWGELQGKFLKHQKSAVH